MESKIAPPPPRITTLVKQSSLAPDCTENGSKHTTDDQYQHQELEFNDNVEPPLRLMYLANEGDLEGINELLDCGTNVNFRDIDGRTALHIACCQGRTDVVQLLIQRGAEIDQKDRWGSTPLADAIYYKNHDVIKLLEKHGAKPLVAPMHVKHIREIPEYEIDQKELDFSSSVDITKGTFRTASWRGIQVAVKMIGEDLINDEDKVSAFRDELALLQRVRHPNVVQFLGAVTQTSPMMIVTEYLPKGDLRAYLKRKRALKPAIAVKFALDIARGMNYLHENKPEPIIHRDLEPTNVLRDDSGHLKVADFGISKFLKVAKAVEEDSLIPDTCRYVAPEVFKNEEYDLKVDIFSFALILYEMIEGVSPFNTKEDHEIPKAYAKKERPPFKAPPKHYSHGLKELIEECWSEMPTRRPTFREIIKRLDGINKHVAHKGHWKVKPLRCFQNLEAIWKKDHSNSSTRNSRSSTRK